MHMRRGRGREGSELEKDSKWAVSPNETLQRNLQIGKGVKNCPTELWNITSYMKPCG